MLLSWYLLRAILKLCGVLNSAALLAVRSRYQLRKLSTAVCVSGNTINLEQVLLYVGYSPRKREADARLVGTEASHSLRPFPPYGGYLNNRSGKPFH